MKKKLQRAFALMLTFCLVMSVLCVSVSATEGKTPYWQTTREVDGVTQTITHAVLASNGNLVDIGAEPPELDTENLEAGNMTAQKFGAFEDEEDAANGIVKLTFDVAGMPVEVPGPLDVVIIADESGSLNMYGRGEQSARLGNETSPKTFRSSASYMPCLNGAHAYLVGDLQKELYQIALARMVAAVGEVDEALTQAVADALVAEDQDAALAALLTDETTAVANAETALAKAQAALAAAEEAHAPFAAAVEEAAAAVEAAENALEEAKGALAEEKAAVEAAQADVDAAQGTADEAQTAANEAKNTADAAQAAVTAAEAALNEAPEEERETVQAVLDAAKADLATANAALETANAALTSANAALATANTALTAAQSAYNEAYAANEAITAAETALDEAEAAYDVAVEAAQETAAAVAAAETAADEAAAAVEAAKAALEAKKATVDALVEVNEMESKLAGEQVAADIYINPHDGGLEYTVFGSWGSAGNEPAVREMIKAAEFVNGDPANVEIPEILTDDDVYLALLSDWDEVALKSNGYLTFTTNYPVIKDGAETGEVKAEKGKRMGWNPDTAHCHFENGAYVLIPQPVNEDTVAEENTLYSYWSPDADNDYGCYDRMIVEKDGIVSLANQILEADPNHNRVAYVGFARGAYPSLNSLGLGEEGDGFCGMGDDDLAELMTIMSNTDGHDYTNYCSALWSLEKLLNGRTNKDVPCYVVFISDGAPNKMTTFMDRNTYSWNLLDPMVDEENEGDYIGYYEICYGETMYYSDNGAEYVASCIKEKWDVPFYTVGFSTNEAASNLLASMASNEDSFFNCANVEEFLSDMNVVQQGIMTHYPTGVLTDVIGDDFELLIDRDHPFTVDGDKYYAQSNAAEDERVTFAAADGETSVNSISWNLEQVDENGVQISFYVKLTEEELNKFEDGTSRIYDTNADTDEAAGANLEYHELIVDDTESEGYYAEEDATNIPMKTPQLKIVNGEDTSENDPTPNDPTPNDPTPNDPTPNDPTPNDPTPNDPLEEIPDEDVPLGELPDVEEPLEEIPDEDIPLAEVPQTGDASALWLILSALSGTGLAGVSVLNHKKRDED